MKHYTSVDDFALRSPGGRVENSPPFQGWDCGIGASSPEGTTESLPHRWDYELTHDIRWFQPSLRDLWNGKCEPGSELPGYSQISLRERTPRSCVSEREKCGGSIKMPPE